MNEKTDKKIKSIGKNELAYLFGYRKYLYLKNKFINNIPLVNDLKNNCYRNFLTVDKYRKIIDVNEIEIIKKYYPNIFD